MSQIYAAAHSPYLNTARVQANSTVLQSPYSPKGRSNSIGPQSHTPQQQQQFTTSGSGLLAAAATDIARAKLSYAFSFQNSAAQGGAKVSGHSNCIASIEVSYTPEVTANTMDSLHVRSTHCQVTLLQFAPGVHLQTRLSCTCRCHPTLQFQSLNRAHRRSRW